MEAAVFYIIALAVFFVIAGIIDFFQKRFIIW